MAGGGEMTRFVRFFSVVLVYFCIVPAVLAQSTATGPASSSPSSTNPIPAPATAVDETSLALADTAEGANGAAAGGSSMLPYFFRMILVLGLVIATIYGLYALLKRSTKPAIASDTYLRLLATTNIGVGRSLHVVSLGDKAWLIGATESSITLISPVDDKELVDALALRAAEAPETPRRDFTVMLNEMLGRKGARKTSSAIASDFFSRQRDRLKKF
jgi:flagellar protein FliO/FliZ